MRRMNAEESKRDMLDDAAFEKANSAMYKVTIYFASKPPLTSRFSDPELFMTFYDECKKTAKLIKGMEVERSWGGI